MPCAWVSSAARRIVPSPPITTASSQPSAAPSPSTPPMTSTSGSVSPSSAASSASSRTAMPWLRSAWTTWRATSRASSRPVWASRRIAARVGVVGHGVHLLIRHPPGPAERRTSRASTASASRGGALRDAARGRTRRCPPAPAAGWSADRRAPQPRRSAAAATVVHGLGPQAGSRTTPPLPSRSLPTSNCGLTISTRSPSGRGHAEQGVEHQPQGDEGQVADDQVDRPADQLRRRARGRWSGRGRAPGGRCRSDQASWP